jgi:cytochrome c
VTRTRVFALYAALLAAGSCVRHVSPEERGAELAADPGFSRSTYNAFACTTCHAERPGGEGTEILPGAPLAGATRRPSYWGGTVLDLHEAVSICYRRFMLGGALDPSSDEAVALYAYLDALSQSGPAVTDAVPFTVPPTAMPPMEGDTTRGATVYQRACSGCHGAPNTRTPPVARASSIPQDTETEHTAAMGYTAESLRAVFVEKTRHGNFLGLAGVMPPFSREVLSDQDVADIVAYLNPQLR